MKRHVIFTGEVGSGKSTALKRTLALLGAKAQGIETYSPGPRGGAGRALYLRAYGSDAQGTLLCTLPESSRDGVTPVFDTEAVHLLMRAQETADVIVVDEIGRLERDAHAYQAALRACLDAGKPVLGVIRKHKADWADFIREREDVLLLEVTQENRDALPALAAARLRDALSDA